MAFCHLPLILVDHFPGRFELAGQGPYPDVVYVQALSYVDFLLHLPHKRPELPSGRPGGSGIQQIPRSCGLQQKRVAQKEVRRMFPCEFRAKQKFQGVAWR